MLKIFCQYIQVSYLLFLLTFTGCVLNNKIKVTLSKKPQSSTATNITLSNVQVINHQIIVTGKNLNTITNFEVKEGASTVPLQIESQTATSIVANTLSNVTFAAGKIFDFVLSGASASATFNVNFSLCDSSLGGKAFDCLITPTDKQVLAYDASSGKWKPRDVNGLNYIGAWDASVGSNPTIKPAGQYYIVSVAGDIDTGATILGIGDWIVSNGVLWQKIDNSTVITSVFNRTGVVVATEGDYDLTKLSDVIIATPSTNQVLKYNGASWVNAVEGDPSVSAFAKTALPTCGAGEVLKSNGSILSCVTDVSGGGSFTGTANRALVTNGSGAIEASSISDTVLGYLSGVTSSIQTQLNSKLSSGTFVDWSTGGVATLDPTRLNLSTANRVVITNATSTPIASTVTTTELGYVSGVTSSIQTQLNSKLSSYTETDPSVIAFAKAALPTCGVGEVLKSNGTSFSCVTDNAGAGSYVGGNNFVIVTNGSGALSDSTISTTQLGYLSTTSSDIQTQLNAKQATITSATAITSGSIQTNLQGAVAVNPYNTAAGNTGEFRFFELAANGSNYTGFKSPDLLGSNIIYTLPGTAPNAGEVLSTTAGGVLSWIAIPSAPVSTVFGRTGAIVATSGDYTGTLVTNTPAGNIAATTTQTAINELDTEKQNISSLAADVRAIALTGLSTATNAVITATDTVLGSFGKLQKQITDLAVSAVGGDLTGNLPNPTVAKIQGTAVSATVPTTGHFFKYDGSNWLGSMVTVGDLKSTALGNLFPGTGCLANQTLYYSVVGDSFSCLDIGTLDGSKITTGTIAAARLPASATFWDTATGGINYAGGKVGIGTTNPSDKLTVYSANAETGMSVVADNTSTNTARYPYVNITNYMGAPATGAGGSPGINLINMRGNTSTSAVIRSSESLGSLTFNGSSDTVGNYKEGAAIWSSATENFSATGSGADLSFYTTANGTTSALPRMTIDQNGNVGIGATAPDSALTISQNTSGLPPLTGYAGTLLHIVGSDATKARVMLDGVGTSSPPIYSLRAARGTAVSPSAVQSGDELGEIGGSGYATTGYATGGKSRMMFFAGENWTDTSTASYLTFQTTPTGSVTQSERMRIDSEGNVGIGTTSPASALDVNGSVRFGADATSCSSTNAGAVRYNSSILCIEVCNGSIWGTIGATAAVPTNTEILMSVCPSGWTDNGVTPNPPTAGAATINGVPGRRCQSPSSTSLIPASSIILMESCPASWTSLGTISSGAGKASFRSSFASCLSPAYAVSFPVNSRFMAASCPSQWNDLGTPPAAPSAGAATCGASSCRVCEVSGATLPSNLIGASGGTTLIGQEVSLIGGTGGSTSGAGGIAALYGGASFDGDGGAISLIAAPGATSTSTARNGGAITMSSGSGVSNGNGGNISITSGLGNGSGTNGNILLNGSSDGNVGIGTTNPSWKLQVNSSVAPAFATILSIDDEIARFHGLNYGIQFQSFSGTAGIIGYKSTYNNLELRASSGVGSQIYLRTTGNVGIGLTNPAEKLDVVGNIKTSGCLYYASSSLGTCASDERIKKDVHSFDLGLDALLGINPVQFKYNGLAGFNNDGKEQLGVIAQDVERAALELIKTQMVQLHMEDKDKTEIKVVDYGAFTYVIINSIKEFYRKWFDDSQNLHREIASLKAKNEVDNVTLKKKFEADNAAFEKKFEAETLALKKENEIMKAKLQKIEKFLEKRK